MSPDRSTQVDLNDTITALVASVTELRALHGTTIPGDGRDRTTVVAPLRADLLRIAHEIDKARASVMDAYHYQLREQRKS